MRPRTVRKLSGLEIDEVSLVDRPANQHGLVAFAKADEESSMDPIFDAEGNEVDPDQLEHGDVVYAEDGQELVFVEDGEPGEGLGEVDDGEYEQQEQLEYEDAGVGKALFPLSAAKAKGGARLARMKFKSAAGNRAVQTGAGGLAVGGAAGYAGGRVGKSLGEQVSKALSKALTEDERDAVISKAMDLLGDVAARNEQLEATVAALIEDRELDAYDEIAKGYEGLPVEPDEFGGILHRVAGVLEPEQLATLDRVFKAAGDAGLYDEVGYGGPGTPAGANEVLEQVYALAGQTVGKAAGGITAEQAVTAIFEANPAAYDEYEAEQRGLR